ncbi:Cyanovirin-N [Leucogyrophana mollusca]|uniref:Cyanovirin-N n=1 Tax=Leucogyrophana mollusca TaxID=85980 RepID=A0ACB8C0F5_9AGAM|nr:Cyanovirin-N [Leucogyrophana mollusca]
MILHQLSKYQMAVCHPVFMSLADCTFTGSANMQFTSFQILASGLMLFGASSAVASGFSSSCNSVSLSGSILYADCRSESGNYAESALDTANCVANYDGNLSCASGGGYTGSCTNCALEAGTTYLLCDCKNGSGGDPASVIDLNTCITNSNGILSC